MGVWLFAMYALAAARLTGLVTVDTITRPARTAVLSHLDEDRPSHISFGALITCQWCTGLWVAAVVAPLSWWHGRNPWVLIPALALAYSQITGLLSRIGRD